MNNVIPFPTATAIAAADAKVVRKVKPTRMELLAEQLELDEATVAAAVAAGLFPKDSKLAPALAVKLIENDGLPATALPDFAVFDGKYKTDDEKMGRLNTRPKRIAVGRTTLTWYGKVVASVQVWDSAECAQRFADYENGRVPRFQPTANTDAKTKDKTPVVWEQVNPVATKGSGKDRNWRVEVI